MKNIFDKITTTFIILAVIGGVGFYLYNINNLEELKIEDVEVETMLLEEIPIYNNSFHYADIENKQVLDIMDNSDASYFNIYLYNDQPDRITYKLSQINKSEYDAFQEQSLVESSDLRFIDIVEKGILEFLNFSYKDVKTRYNSDLYNSYVFESIFGDLAPNTETTIDGYFSDNIDNVFVNNEIELSCEDIEFTKICNTVFADDYVKDKYQDYNDRFLCIGTCKVNVKTLKGEETIETKVKVAGMIEKRSNFTEPYYVFLSNIIFEQ